MSVLPLPGCSMGFHDYLRVRSHRLRRTTRLVVIEGSEFDTSNRDSHRLLAQTDDATAIAAAVSAVAFTDDDRMYWTTTGGPTLAFLDGRDLQIAVTCVLPGYVRSEGNWEGDAKLVDGNALNEVLRTLASQTAASWLDEGRAVKAIAPELRRSYALSPGSTVAALRQAGVSLAEGKEAVDATLSPTELTATERLRDAAIDALDATDADWTLPDPWVLADDAMKATFETAARKEISRGHDLFPNRRHLRLIARCTACDESLFALEDGSFAMVHLTFAGASERPPWPHSTRLRSFLAAELAVAQHSHDNH